MYVVFLILLFIFASTFLFSSCNLANTVVGLLLVCLFVGTCHSKYKKEKGN